MDVFRFLTEIAPDLFKLGEALFKLFSGNAELAKQNIRSRVAEVEANRAEVDRLIAEKHAG